jgi:hypothetical protein
LFKIKIPKNKNAIAQSPRQSKNKGLKLWLSDWKKKNKGAKPMPTMNKQKPDKCLKPMLFFFS